MAKKNATKELRNLKTVDTNNKDIIVEKHIHRTNKQRILHILCLLLPIAMAFAGYFASIPLYHFFCNDNETTPEYFKFLITLAAFLITATVIFFATRKENPIIKIDITSR